MPFWGRAKYNHLQMQTIEDLRLGKKDIRKDYKIVEYHKFSFEELFSTLYTLGVHWDSETFIFEAENWLSPEELTHSLGLSEKKEEEAYLCIFEIWRRLLDDHETISIFCDELDWAIFFYDRKETESKETIRLMLQEFVDILDFNIESGKKPKNIFKHVSFYLAQDLEEFLYRYIRDIIEDGEPLVASKLLEHFMPYIEGNLWFEFLQLKTMQGASSEDTTAIISRFIERLQECSDVELFLTFLGYLLEIGNRDIFIQIYQNVLGKVKTEKTFL